MSFVKTLNRKIILPIIYKSNLYRFVGQTPRRIILCYHGVAPNPDFTINYRHMPVRQFENDLLFFKKNYEVISVAEAFRRTNENKPIKNWEVVLTFDDGFLNNYTHVKPLLEKYNLPATFYILSKAITQKDFINWADLMDCILKSINSKEVSFNRIPFYRAQNWQNESGISLFDYLKGMGEERESALQEFTGSYGKTAFTSISELLWKPMNAEQIIECSKSPFITIGSHTDSHYNLANISLNLAKTELEKSKEIISNLIQTEVAEIA